MQEQRKTDRRQQDRLLTEHQVADMAAVSVNTVKFWRQIGILPFVKIGRHPRVWLSAFYQVFRKPISGGALGFTPTPDTMNSAGDIRRSS